MKIKLFLLLLLSFFSVTNLFSQYQLKPAFPNLSNFSYPIEMVQAFDGTNRLFVAQQRGLIYVFDNSPNVSSKKIFLNMSGKVSASGGEAGLLGLAFHPNYENNRYFYLNYTFDSASVLFSRISRFTASSSNPDTTLPSTEQILLTLQQPYSNHNGGKVSFGPDGYLYISFGDGGSGGDPDGNGQKLTTLLGKILRINVDSSANGKNYSIPVSNPFYGNLSGYKEEIYAYGLRNVWKFSFDYSTGKLWAGDVGQNAYEEIDIIEKGKNYGWNKMEGFHCYGTCDTTGKGFVRPVHEYPHASGLSVTGGYVYRGSLLPGLYGKYLFADYQYSSLWALSYDGINPTTNVQLWDSTNNTFFISALGTDQNNEIYVVRYGLTLGAIYKIVNSAVSTLDLKTSIQGFYNTGNNSLNIKDTVKVYLRTAAIPYNIVDSAKSVIDSLSLKGLYFFSNAPTGKYYFVLRHRNALETWSRNGGDSLKRALVTAYDFTNDSSKVYGNNEIKTGSVYSIYNGDTDQDGVIDASDLSNVENDVSNSTSGYVFTDLTGDYFVDAEDLAIVENNTANSVQLIRP